MVAEVVSELAKLRGTSFDKAAIGFRFARAALIDPKFKPEQQHRDDHVGAVDAPTSLELFSSLLSNAAVPAELLQRTTADATVPVEILFRTLLDAGVSLELIGSKRAGVAAS